MLVRLVMSLKKNNTSFAGYRESRNSYYHQFFYKRPVSIIFFNCILFRFSNEVGIAFHDYSLKLFNQQNSCTFFPFCCLTFNNTMIIGVCVQMLNNLKNTSFSVYIASPLCMLSTIHVLFPIQNSLGQEPISAKDFSIVLLIIP